MQNFMLNILYRLMEKDMATYEHSMRVGRMAKIMALFLHLSPQQTRSLVAGCLMHDVGKILIPDGILRKESSLAAAEWELMMAHPILGASLAVKEGIESQAIIEIIKYHHERWDGAGYPYGLRGNHIPTYARICSIIDAFDCMVHDRPYRKAVSIQEAKDELLYQCRKQFDKNLVEVFVNIPEQHLKMYSICIA